MRRVLYIHGMNRHQGGDMRIVYLGSREGEVDEIKYSCFSLLNFLSFYMFFFLVLSVFCYFGLTFSCRLLRFL